MRSRGAGRTTIGCALALLGMSFAPAAASLAPSDLTMLSIEELANLQISAVSKTPEPIGTAPAAVYVITAEDIRRSGATTLTEILRLAPNLQVGRIDAGDYAVSARGFNIGTANKLLVMIDGRTVYTPLYAGVFWDMQSVMPAEIDRIEVVSGPGGTLWGSNAVNGVINVVTRDAAASEGALVRASGGNADYHIAARLGGAIGSAGHFKVYAEKLEQGETRTATGADAGDIWQLTQTGGRFDWQQGTETYTIQGDYYEGRNKPSPTARIALRGGNILGRYGAEIGGGTLQVQAYFDHASRAIVNGIVDALDTYDITGHYAFGVSNHSIVAGGGYRTTSDRLTPFGKSAFLNPAHRILHLGNVFVQDSITLAPTLKLTLGLKAEHNSYTGMEFMPDARLAWEAAPATLLWAAMSRATRTPSRFDRDLFNTGILAGGPNFQSENVIAYEAGYRGQPFANATLSVSVFYNDYDDLRTTAPTGGPAIFPLVIANGLEGRTYGIEAWGSIDPTPWWRLKAGVNALHKDLELKPGAISVLGIQTEGNDPDHQFSLRSQMNFAHGLEFDAGLRAIASLPNPAVPAYVAVDARIGWVLSDRLQLAVAGFNLLDDRHPEFVVTSPPQRDQRRTVYASARWDF